MGSIQIGFGWNRQARRVAWLAPLIAVAPVVLAHCSGDATLGGTGMKKPDASTAPSDAAGVQPMGDDGSGSVTPDAGTIPLGDGAISPPPGDAAPEASSPPPIPVPEGGAPSDPGTVPCNGSACNVSQGYSCCIQAADGGSKETCNPPNTPCGGDPRTVKLECNEAADCNGGVCCQAINGIAVPGSTTCTAGPSCPGATATTMGTFKTCRTNGECGAVGDGGATGAAAARCIPQLCTSTMPPRTLKIEACAVAATAQNPGGTLGYCAAQ